MTDLINASPIIVLAVVGVLAWFTGNKGLKILTLGIFFLYPVVLGKVQFDVSMSYVGDIVKYWVTEALQSLIEYVKQSLV